MKYRRLIFVALIPLLIAADRPIKSPSEIISEAPESAWKTIDNKDIIIVKLKDGAQFSFALASEIAPIHAENIKKLVRAGWFQNSAITRVQDNYVVQWGAPETNILPNDIIKNPPAEYEFAKPKDFIPLPFKDAYTKKAGIIDIWPAASDNKNTWLVHCYGMVGVGRDMPPDTGTGQELYTIIGHAPRHLDRNITLVGRIIDGMENLSARPRGTAELGFYAEESQKIPFEKAIMASDLPQAEQVKYQIMLGKSDSYKAYVNARANRGAPFFIKASASLDICNAMPPIRKK